MNASSYTAASTLPAKVIQKAHEVYAGGMLKPVHVQISPTNVCQLECPFCSCANRQNRVEMDVADYLSILGTFKGYGCQAVTITGGGEPTLHKRIDDILLGTHALGIQSGLVSNGLSLDNVCTDALKTLTWARLSFSDDRHYTGSYVCKVMDAVKRAPAVDWAFSYVVTKDTNVSNICSIIGLANELEFTHVRLVTDLLDLDGAPDMELVKAVVRGAGIDDRRVIYQGRKAYQRGAERCLISLVKPVIAADGGWFPCCGVQYALDTQGLDFEPTMCMGRDVKTVIETQQPFNGSVCARCYYGDYNATLAAIVDPLEHGAFV